MGRVWDARTQRKGKKEKEKTFTKTGNTCEVPREVTGREGVVGKDEECE